MIKVCEYCNTDVDIGDYKVGVERTMESYPPTQKGPSDAAFLVYEEDENNKRRVVVPVIILHRCRKGKVVESDESRD